MAGLEPAFSDRQSEAFPDGNIGIKWWEVDGIEPLALKGDGLQPPDGTSLSLLALPINLTECCFVFVFNIWLKNKHCLL